MSLTPQQLKAAFFNVLKTDSAGTAVRAALGDGATSVIPKEDLNKPLPATPFVVFQWIGQPSGGSRNRGIRTYYPIWFLYDDIVKQYFRLEALIPLIEAAYPEDAIKMCYTDFLPVRELPDKGLLNMPAKSMAFTIKTRG
jgi:hypothetical protein